MTELEKSLIGLVNTEAQGLIDYVEALLRDIQNLLDYRVHCIAEDFSARLSAARITSQQKLLLLIEEAISEHEKNTSLVLDSIASSIEVHSAGEAAALAVAETSSGLGRVENLDQGSNIISVSEILDAILEIANKLEPKNFLDDCEKARLEVLDYKTLPTQDAIYAYVDSASGEVHYIGETYNLAIRTRQHQLGLEEGRWEQSLLLGADYLYYYPLDFTNFSDGEEGRKGIRRLVEGVLVDEIKPTLNGSPRARQTSRSKEYIYSDEIIVRVEVDADTGEEGFYEAPIEDDPMYRRGWNDAQAEGKKRSIARRLRKNIPSRRTSTVGGSLGTSR